MVLCARHRLKHFKYSFSIFTNILIHILKVGILINPSLQMSKKLHSSSVTHPELEPRLSGPRAWDRNYHAMQSPTLSTRKWELGRLNNWPNYIGPPPLQITELSKNPQLSGSRTPLPALTY